MQTRPSHRLHVQLKEQAHQQAVHVCEMYFEQDMTLAEVGAALLPPVTRERVRQIIKKAIGGPIPKEAKKLSRHNIKTKCQQCQKPMTLLRYQWKTRRYITCSVPCGRAIRGWPVTHLKEMTIPERRAYENAQHKRYWHSVKHLPKMKAMIKRNNHRQALKRQGLL